MLMQISETTTTARDLAVKPALKQFKQRIINKLYSVSSCTTLTKFNQYLIDFVC